MVNKLYLRLMATQCLLLVMGGFLFWLTNIVFGWPDPLAIMVTVFGCMIAASVVIGVVLQPLDEIHVALRHVANGEDVPLPTPRSADIAELVSALAKLQGHGRGDRGSAELVEVLNSLSEGILVMDPAGRVTFVNTTLRALAEDGPEDDGPERYRHTFHARCFVPDQLALIEEEMFKAPDRPRTDIVQLERPRQFIKRYSAPLYNDKREHTGFLVSFTDITREMEQDQLRQDFIANASHELRTPVTSVKVLLENLQDGAKDDPAVRDEFIDDAAREIDRMHDLVNDLLDLAALEAGRQKLQIVAVEIPKVMREAVATVQPQAKARGVTIETAWPEGASALEADATRLRQVLVNLVTNAVKFTPAGGTVRVAAVLDGEVARFSVSDTGIGIPSQDLPHIFDRFYRVTRGRSRLQGGSGLGLTIVKQAIDAHRGEIIVESTVGQGTSFNFALPLRQEKDGLGAPEGAR